MIGLLNSMFRAITVIIILGYTSGPLKLHRQASSVKDVRCEV